MSEPARASNSMYCFLPTEVEGFGPLAELALDMRWSWNHAGDDLWQQLDPELWELTHNPWVVLQTVSRDQLQQMLADPVFRQNADALVQSKREAAESPAWFQRAHAQSPLTCVAYFSMEFMLSEALPIYSGGLGNVAGDQLKAASDLGVPVVAVGLLCQQGYFRQAIDKDGAQQTLFPYNDPGQLPITPLRQPDGEWLRLDIALPGYSVWLRAWQNSNDSSESFNMDYLAIRGSGAINGVSRLHAKVSRHVFEPLFPHWPEDEVPVGHVTNEVHMPIWDSKAADGLWMAACGQDRWLGTLETLEQDIRRVSDSGEGRWTVAAAIDESAPAQVISAALYDRFSSRGEADFADRVLSAMRYAFGGHVEKAAAPKGGDS